jgi:hypothetical protein
MQLKPSKFYRNKLSVAARLLLAGSMASGLAVAQSGDKLDLNRGTDPDPNYAQTVIEEGRGWQLVELKGQTETGEDFFEQMYMVSGELGVANAPLPKVLLEDMIEDIAADPKGNHTVSVSKKLVDELEISIAQEKPTDELLRMAEMEMPPEGLVQNSVQRADCNDWVYQRGSAINFASPLNYNFGIGNGFTGNLALTGNASVNGTGNVSFGIKRFKIRFLWMTACIPYGAHFRDAQVSGKVAVDQGVALTGTVNYANPTPREWQLLKPHLYSTTFFIGYIPVHIGLNLPITVGFDQGGITGSVSGQVAYNGRRATTAYLNYACNASSCSGSSTVDTVDLGAQPITSSISGRFQPNIYAQVAARAYLYTEGVAYAQVGVRPYLRGDLWGYYGNTCGSAAGNGINETVRALTFDLDWQVHVTAQADTFFTNQWNSTLWQSPRWHIGFWDLLGRSGSTAASPLLNAPAIVPANYVQNYGVRMRPCWPYSDTMNYTVDWLDGSALQALSGQADTQVNVPHNYVTPGLKLAKVRAISDSHGRNLGRESAREVNVQQLNLHKGTSWRALRYKDNYTRVGKDALTNSTVGDTDAVTALPMLCINPIGLDEPDWWNFGLHTFGIGTWTGAELRITAPIQGFNLSSRAVADSLCANLFGGNYRMADIADGVNPSGVNLNAFWGLGPVTIGQRFWIAVSNNPANPWN